MVAGTKLPLTSLGMSCDTCQGKSGEKAPEMLGKVREFKPNGLLATMINDFLKVYHMVPWHNRTGPNLKRKIKMPLAGLVYLSPPGGLIFIAFCPSVHPSVCLSGLDLTEIQTEQ